MESWRFLRADSSFVSWRCWSAWSETRSPRRSVSSSLASLSRSEACSASWKSVSTRFCTSSMFGLRLGRLGGHEPDSADAGDQGQSREGGDQSLPSVKHEAEVSLRLSYAYRVS